VNFIGFFVNGKKPDSLINFEQMNLLGNGNGNEEDGRIYLKNFKTFVRDFFSYSINMQRNVLHMHVEAPATLLCHWAAIISSMINAKVARQFVIKFFNRRLHESAYCGLTLFYTFT
jgi:hypothetical protein